MGWFAELRRWRDGEMERWIGLIAADDAAGYG